MSIRENRRKWWGSVDTCKLAAVAGVRDGRPVSQVAAELGGAGPADACLAALGLRARDGEERRAGANASRREQAAPTRRMGLRLADVARLHRAYMPSCGGPPMGRRGGGKRVARFMRARRGSWRAMRDGSAAPPTACMGLRWRGV